MQATTTKTVAPRIWKSWKIVSQPTTTRGMIRKDEAGRCWEGMWAIQEYASQTRSTLIGAQEAS
jgi:hypothetical protein